VSCLAFPLNLLLDCLKLFLLLLLDSPELLSVPLVLGTLFVDEMRELVLLPSSSSAPAFEGVAEELVLLVLLALDEGIDVGQLALHLAKEGSTVVFANLPTCNLRLEGLQRSLAHLVALVPLGGEAKLSSSLGGLLELPLDSVLALLALSNDSLAVLA